MDVFWKGYFTFSDLESRWSRTREEIDSVIMSGKLVPSYFLRSREARSIGFIKDEDADGEWFSPDDDFPSNYVHGKFVYLRLPERTGLTDYSFTYCCEHHDAPMDAVPFWDWYMFDIPINSRNREIVFLKAQVDRFEKIRLPELVATTAIKSPYPWGDHSTHLLNKLIDVATAMWSRYDPLDPSTAPTNDQVRDWLMERNVPKRTAAIMATILRADNLRPGRRKT